MAPSFGRAAQLPQQFDVQVDSVSGSGNHFGLSLAYAQGLSGGARVQAGLALERLDVREYRVAFRTLDLAQNFDGAVDYSGIYNIVTPFAIYESLRRPLTAGWSGGWSATIAWPLPRRGFIGRLTGLGIDFQGSTASAGNGKHIPDPFLGLGYTFEHKATGLQVDLGATLFSYVVEPLGHRKIDQSLFINLSLPF
jgi:hypothetical protein